MKPIKFNDIQRRHYRPECTENFPTDFYFEGEESICRGRVVQFEGSEGIIWDLRYHDDGGSIEADVMVHWYSGPLSSEKTKRSQTYNLKEFLAMLGWELVYEE